MRNIPPGMGPGPNPMVFNSHIIYQLISFLSNS